MKRKWLIVAMAACILGSACALLSLDSYFRIQKSGVAEASFCSVSNFVDCDVVEASSYSSIGAIPVAGLGLIYYLIIFIFSATARFSKGIMRPTVAFAWWSSLLSIIFTGYMAYISAIVLSVVCLTCLGMYVANLLLFISLYLAMGMPVKEWHKFLWGYWASVFTRKKLGIDFSPRFWSHALAALVIFGIGMVFISSAASNISKPSGIETEDYVNRFVRQSKYDLKFDKESTPVWGTKGAPVTIVEFSDYRCPFCRIAAFMVKPFLVEYKKYIQYYFLNYPLDSTCNHYIKNQMHPGACLGARAALCAGREGKFWEYHDALFRSQGIIDDRLVVNLARKAGLNKDGFVDCLNSPAIERKLQDDIETARRIYVMGTPSVFVNDRPLKLWKSPDIVRAVIKKEIELSKKPSR